MRTELRIGSATDVGRIRTNNEDQLLIAEPLFAVADGMGGHQAGEIASNVALESLRVAFASGETPTTAALEAAVVAANRAVFERSAAEVDLAGMGTTVTAVALVEEDGEERLAIANVGDSRAYLFKAGELERLTDDHSVVEELVRRGELTAAEAAVDPRRHYLTRALGIQPDVEVDVWEVIPFTGDRVMLCSDGLSNEVTDPEIASVLRRHDDPQEAARELVARAVANGGSDNVTVVVVDVVDDGGRAAEASATLAAATEAPTVAAGAVPSPPVTPPTPAPPPTDTEGDASSAAAVTPDSPAAATPFAVDDADEDGGPRRSSRARTIAFVVAVVALLGIAFATLVWYARGSYFVGEMGGDVAIFQGRPGGLLWFDSTLTERTDLSLALVPEPQRSDVRAGEVVASLADARRYVQRLRQRVQEGAGPVDFSPSSTAPATTTSVATPPGTAAR